MTNSRDRQAHNDEGNWGLLSSSESDYGTSHDNELVQLCPAPMTEEKTDPGWVADFTSLPAAPADQKSSPQGRVHCSKINHNFIFIFNIYSWDRRHVTNTKFF